MNTTYNFPLKKQVDSYMKIPENKKKYYSDNTYVLLPKELGNLIKDFISYKLKYGSSVEKKFYRDITPSMMIKRLLIKRPLMFLGSDDIWLDKYGNRGCEDWDKIGTDEEVSPLVMDNYITYEEIELSSFISLSIYTPFINTGSRRNIGIPDENHEPEGVYIGQAGARFEISDKMESKHMLIDKNHTHTNGYGKNSKSPYMKMWADFYKISYFPTYEEAKTDTFGRFVKIAGRSDAYLNTFIYKRRLMFNASVFLQDANNRAKKLGKKAFVYAVGLGLGAWAIDKELQIKITIEVYLNLLKKLELPYISELYFGWFNISGLRIIIPPSIQGINLNVGYRNPSESLNDKNLLLVSNWAWDPNSYVGNEYWNGRLGTSGDPAAACSSYIAFLGNPDVNDINRAVII
jgi:hypothetical protein